MKFSNSVTYSARARAFSFSARAWAFGVSLGVLSLGGMAPALAQSGKEVKIGFITTLSTPAGYLGEDIRDAFKLAMKDGKLGNTPVTLEIEDDGLKPASAKQIADRMVQSGIKLYTGINFSNVLGAVLPDILASGAIYVSPNAGPSTFAGDKCHKNYYVVSFQNDAFHEASGIAGNDLGYKKMVLLAPNYQAGKDALEGFKRTYKGQVIEEIYTKLDQTDFSVELARVRALAPDAIYQFHPGGTGINFAKQYANAGLSGSIPMLLPTFSMDTRMVVATGNAAEGVIAVGSWSPELDIPASKAFVEAFRKAYNRTPTLYAAQGYDTALAIGKALDAVGGDVTKVDDFRKAMLKADFPSVRGKFAFNNNQHPIQDYYATRFEKDASGQLVQKVIRKVAENYKDAYAAQCKLN